jgi:2-polyprenyl-6-hydroxyphenyl methylase/3-demethylubiquinone-9 3-methyltransferase
MLIERFLKDVTRWAESEEGISAVALVGSHARGEAGPGSDIDLIVLSSEAEGLADDTAWVTRFGTAVSTGLEDYGRVTSVRVHYDSGLEVEFSLSNPDWARLPLDEGTRAVLADGTRVLYDDAGLLSSALQSIRSDCRPGSDCCSSSARCSSSGYYSRKLSGDRLRRCYAVAPPRVRRYLEAEIEFVLSHVRASDQVLELGCGYGRAALRFASVARRVVGVDTSMESLALARALDVSAGRCEFLHMDASSLSFGDSGFDLVACIQNGLCAFGVDRKNLVREALRVARPGGRVLFSTYSSAFWEHRLEWFRLQARAGLIGEIDESETGGGTIVCRDGLRLDMMCTDELMELGVSVGAQPEIVEVDESAVFAVWVAT